MLLSQFFICFLFDLSLSPAPVSRGWWVVLPLYLHRPTYLVFDTLFSAGLGWSANLTLSFDWSLRR